MWTKCAYEATASSVDYHLQIEAVARGEDELVIAGHQLQPAVALHHAGQVREVARVNVEELVELEALPRMVCRGESREYGSRMAAGGGRGGARLLLWVGVGSKLQSFRGSMSARDWGAASMRECFRRKQHRPNGMHVTFSREKDSGSRKAVPILKLAPASIQV